MLREVEAALGLSRPERGSGLEAREKKERGWKKAFLFMKKDSKHFSNHFESIFELVLKHNF